MGHLPVNETGTAGEGGKISIEEYLKKNKELTYSNVGTSMMPMLKQGRDLFTVRYHEGGPLHKNDVILFKRRDGRLVLHRIIRVCPDGTYEARGDNCVTSEKGIRAEDVLGVMTSFVHKGRRISVDSPAMRCLTLLIKCERGLRKLRRMIGRLRRRGKR